MKVGISQLILPDLPLEDFFAACAAAGYEGVELCLGGESPLQLSNTEEEIPRIRALSQQYGLPVVSLVHCQCSASLLAGGEEQKRNIEQTCAGLETARKLGVETTLYTLGQLSPDLYYDEAYENAVKGLQMLGRAAESIGVSLAVEFVWNGFLFSPLEMKRLLEEVGSRAIGFYFDPGNMAVFQYPHHWVRILGPYIKMVHMKDWKGNATDGCWPALLEGNIDFARVMEELRAVEYDGYLISEVDSSVCSIDDTAQRIRKILSN